MKRAVIATNFKVEKQKNTNHEQKQKTETKNIYSSSRINLAHNFCFPTALHPDRRLDKDEFTVFLESRNMTEEQIEE